MAQDEFDAMFKGSLETPYDQTRFYTRATNDHNHGTPITVSVPPEILAMAGEIVESKLIPEYRGVGDVIRDALVHRMEYINSELLKDDRYSQVLTNELFAGRQASMQMAIDRRKEILDQAEVVMSRYSDAGDVESLVEVIETHEDHAESWPPIWQEHMNRTTDRYRELHGIKRTRKRTARHLTLASVQQIKAEQDEQGAGTGVEAGSGEEAVNGRGDDT